MGVLPQGHDKVISRSNRLILMKNDTYFLKFICVVNDEKLYFDILLTNEPMPVENITCC